MVIFTALARIAPYKLTPAEAVADGSAPVPDGITLALVSASLTDESAVDGQRAQTSKRPSRLV